MIDINTLPIPSSYRWMAGKIVDNFAGGGGASTGIAQAIGKSPDIVVHNCTHFSVAKGGKPVKKAIRGLAWIDIREGDAE